AKVSVMPSFSFRRIHVAHTQTPVELPDNVDRVGQYDFTLRWEVERSYQVASGRTETLLLVRTAHIRIDPATDTLWMHRVGSSIRKTLTMLFPETTPAIRDAPLDLKSLL